MVRITIHFTEWSTGGDSCKGDSGSGLVVAGRDTEEGDDEDVTFVAVGIYSMGGAKCKGELPGMFTNINNYRKWIGGIVGGI